MLLQVLENDVIGYVAACRARVASGPKPAPPIALAEFGKFLLDFTRRTALHPLHELTDCNMRRNFDKHMDVIVGKNTVYNFHAQFRADLPDDCTDPLAYLPTQNFVPVLGNQNDMVAMMKNRMTSSPVTHSLSPENEGLVPSGTLIFRRQAMGNYG